MYRGNWSPPLNKQRPHANLAGKQADSGEHVASLEHLNNIYKTKSTLILYSCRAWLPRRDSSPPLASTSTVLTNTRGWGICSLVTAFASCPLVGCGLWGMWQYLTCWAGTAPSACPKGQVEKACDFSAILFLTSTTAYWQPLACFLSNNILGILTLHKQCRNTKESCQDPCTSQSTSLLHATEETILLGPKGKSLVKMGKRSCYYRGSQTQPYIMPPG